MSQSKIDSLYETNCSTILPKKVVNNNYDQK